MRTNHKPSSTDALEEVANAIRARRWAKLLQIADRHRLELEGDLKVDAPWA